MSKIPELMRHFAEHQQKNPQISFLDFISLHFQDEKHHEEDHEKHTKLPFQHDYNGSVTGFVVNVVCSFPLKFELDNSLFLLSEADIAVSEENLFFTSPSFDIWQPPKIVK